MANPETPDGPATSSTSATPEWAWLDELGAPGAPARHALKETE